MTAACTVDIPRVHGDRESEPVNMNFTSNWRGASGRRHAAGLEASDARLDVRPDLNRPNMLRKKLWLRAA